jgi:hypothetical protein
MQRVQALIDTARPLRITVVFWMFGRNMRFVRFLEKLTLCPNATFFPHTSHTPAMVVLHPRAVTPCPRFRATRLPAVRVRGQTGNKPE